MKNYFFIKASILLSAALLVRIPTFGESKEVSGAQDFVKFCTSKNYKNVDEIILIANIEASSDITLKKNLKIRSKDGARYTYYVTNNRQFKIDPEYTLTITNLVIDGKKNGTIYSSRYYSVFTLNSSSDTNKIARLELTAGTTIKDVQISEASRWSGISKQALIYAQKGSRVIIREGVEILNCHNKSAEGNGGAINCESGNVIIEGGVIANCSAKGSGGAIRVTGARNTAEDHLGVAMRGDIFLYGGYITNNVCGERSATGAECYGGGIYLGETGPMLHVIGPAVVSNNVCKVITGGSNNNPTYTEIPDDVSTFELDEIYANRLKLSGDKSGLMFDKGWIGVRFPDLRGKTETEIEEELKKRSFGGVWEYFTSTHEEARQFFWNHDNRYRGWMNNNALVWTRQKIYQLPLDRTTVKEVLQAADTNFPIFIEFNGGFVMNKDAYGDSHIRIPDGLNVTFDLQGHSITCNLEVANGGSVTFRDSSTNRSGRVWGYRDVVTVGDGAITKDSQAYTNAYRLEGGSYRTKPDPAWVATNCVVVGNYCEVHPWMVARLAWETNLTSRVADVTLVPLETVDNEIRDVVNISSDVDEITYSTGDWVRNAHTNRNYHVRVLAVPAISNETSNVLEEIGPRVVYFDTAENGVVDHNNIQMPENQPQILPSNDANDGNAISYGREDAFIWKSQKYDLIKLIHITYRKSGAVETTNAIEQAYFRFPKAVFEATQRQTNGQLPIKIVDSLLTALGYNRAQGFHPNNVNTKIDGYDANGLRLWENIVTGTDENQLLLSTAEEVEGGLSLKIALADADKSANENTGYRVRYDLRKYDEAASSWKSVAEINDTPNFSIPLLDAENKSAGATGFYRVTTLIIPDKTITALSVTNEIPSTNIVGVLEVASTLTNTLAAVPWTKMGTDPAVSEDSQIRVSDYVHTEHLGDDDAVQVADAGHIYRKWHWNKKDKKWGSAITVSRSGAEKAPDAEEHGLSRTSAVWVERNDPAAKPFFLIGQYSNAPLTLEISAGSPESMTCTLVPNPSMKAIKVNDYGWKVKVNDNDWKYKPIAGNKGDVIRIPNEKKVPHNLTWNDKTKTWGRWVKQQWKDDETIPAGTGFWYMRRGDSFEISLPISEVK